MAIAIGEQSRLPNFARAGILRASRFFAGAGPAEKPAADREVRPTKQDVPKNGYVARQKACSTERARITQVDVIRLEAELV